MRRLMRYLPIALLVVALLLAGCASLVPSDDGTASPETTVETFSYPSGWSQNGTTGSPVGPGQSTKLDLTAIQQTHYDAVDGVSRTTRVVTTTDSGYNRTVVRTVDLDSRTASLRFVDTDFHTDHHSYYDGESVYEYDRNAGELVSVSDHNGTIASVGTFESETFNQPLSNLELNATEIVRSNGTTAVRYTVAGLADPSLTPATNASGSIVVTETGYIAEFNITKPNYRRVTFNISEYGTATVSRPEWVPEE